MTRLTWDAAGERFYELGVDRGVLYVGEQGYAWSGLVSVEERPQGGEAKPFYIDGFKYANVAAAEEFEATITAFSSPPEFGPCDGSGLIHNGLIATQQPRKPFSFTYRTKIGNDTDGVDHGYKIHLVYNSLAAPSSRMHATMSEQNTPEQLRWSITTLAPRAMGLRPTAHFVVDSRTTAVDILIEIENILYGDDNNSSRMPTVLELMDLFSG